MAETQAPPVELTHKVGGPKPTEAKTVIKKVDRKTRREIKRGEEFTVLARVKCVGIAFPPDNTRQQNCEILEMIEVDDGAWDVVQPRGPVSYPGGEDEDGESRLAKRLAGQIEMETGAGIDGQLEPPSEDPDEEPEPEEEEVVDAEVVEEGEPVDPNDASITDQDREPGPPLQAPRQSGESRCNPDAGTHYHGNRTIIDGVPHCDCGAEPSVREGGDEEDDDLAWKG